MTQGAAVAAGNRVTAEAAAEVLRAGGNAYDAALAGLIASCIAEPVLCSLFGGGFLLAQPAAGPPRVFDFFTQTPGRRGDGPLDFRGVHADFGAATQEFHIGRAAAAVPGIPAGIHAVHRALGKLPLADALAPGLAAARNGVDLDPLQADILRAVEPIFTATPDARALYCGQDGALMTSGTRLRLPGLASLVQGLIEEGPRLFYEGDIADRIADLCQDGGLLTCADLARYAVKVRPPRETSYRGAHLFMNDLPSSGGPLIALTLALLGGVEPALAPSDPERTFRLIKAMQATGDARRASGFALNPNPDTVRALLDEDRIRSQISALKTGGTTHISVADSQGNLASLSLSNGEGNGEIVPGTDQMLNNMLGEEDLNPAGFFRWTPDTRVSSMMTPCVARFCDGTTLALGSGGSNRIRSAIVQTLIHLTETDKTLADALAAPRVHVEGGAVSIEGGFPDSVAAALKARLPDARFWPGQSFFFGGVHAAGITPRGPIAAGDPRRGGHSIVLG